MIARGDMIMKDGKDGIAHTYSFCDIYRFAGEGNRSRKSGGRYKDAYPPARCLRIFDASPFKESIGMKIKELMTSDVKSCGLDTNLAAAAKIMWEEDCGAVPVTDESGHVVGVITDRDICIAGATRPNAEGEIPVREVISDALYTCTPGDDARAALETMRRQKVRRLPVVDDGGRLAGIVSIHDLAMHARTGKSADVPAEAVIDAFVAISSATDLRVHV